MSLLVAAVAAIVLIPTDEPVAVSPAAALLDAVKARMEEAYYPRPGVDVQQIMANASTRLEEACRPTGAACPTETGLEVVRGAIAELGDGHTLLMRAPSPPPGQGGGQMTGPPSRSLPLGWATRTVRGSGEIYVTWVDPDGPAGQAGIRRHDLIVPAEGVTAAMLNTGAGPISVSVERQGKRSEVQLVPDAARGGATPRLTIRDDIAVIEFPTGGGSVGGQMGHDLVARAAAAGAKAVVLDLRDNSGGGIQCDAMAAAFVDYSTVQRQRNGDANVLSVKGGEIEMGPLGAPAVALRVERPTRWTGPLAVLVNRNTGSCAEAIAINIERTGRGEVFGEKTYGVGNNTVRPFPLTDGWAIQMTIAYAEDERGARLPATPPLAVEIADDPVAIARSGHDAVLEAALVRLKAA